LATVCEEGVWMNFYKILKYPYLKRCFWRFLGKYFPPSSSVFYFRRGRLCSVHIKTRCFRNVFWSLRCWL